MFLLPPPMYEMSQGERAALECAKRAHLASSSITDPDDSLSCTEAMSPVGLPTSLLTEAKIELIGRKDRPWWNSDGVQYVSGN
ncbi:unnamed protein product [Peniophora sp. CBMAI 1063]|nr:unnamed protein product [Peniophora sp. CBMAI 1063]